MLAALPLIALLLTAPGGKGVSRVEQGQKLFNQGDFDGALKALDAAAADGGEPATLEKVQLLRAQCFAARQDFVKAEEAFGLALDANPDASLDPARVDPTVVKMLEAVRVRSVGAVIVNSTPPGASVTVDGKSSGAAPTTLSLPAGKHKIEAKWAEGPPQSIEVQVRPKQQTRVEWVQVEGKPIAPSATPIEHPIRPFGDLRGMFEPATSGAVDGGLELGGGIALSWFRIALFARLYPTFALTPRFQFSLPVATVAGFDFNVVLEAGHPFTFLRDGLGLGFQGAGGVEWAIKQWFAAYVLIGGRFHYRWPGRNDDTAFTAAAGVRLQIP